MKSNLDEIEKRLREIQGTEEKHLWRIEHNTEWLWTTVRRCQALLERINLALWFIVGLLMGIVMIVIFK